MTFLADLHIHSKYSMATAKNSDLENNYISAAKKGISIVGTGDFTHPKWFGELSEKLEKDNDSGLYRLKKDLEKEVNKEIPDSCNKNIRFMLQCEVSSIYKKNGKVRKNHNLVYFPTLESVKKFNSKLDLIGNIKSDGRPILGLDAKKLLEITLETDPEAFFVPAHIWTPWFSLFGSKSGFDSIEECFEDLSSEIFALETGLSSDPEMNWMISELDRFSLISNSDAHSPGKLGREVNIFDCNMSYYEMKDALKNKDNNRFKGTFEFFPEEGKYHYDGHRKCDVCLSPEESLKFNGKCPVCGKDMTLGVMYRVSQLADRKDIKNIKKEAPPYYSIVPLTDILSEILKVGPNTKKVKNAFENIINVTGSEFNALWWAEPDLVDKAGIPLLSEAVKRMRNGDIHINPGYDGEFGKIKIFDEKEIIPASAKGQKSLFEQGDLNKTKLKRKSAVNEILKAGDKFVEKEPKLSDLKEKKNVEKLNKKQMEAVSSKFPFNVVIAGPGTGKTSTLTSKISDLIENKKIDPEKILALTFTIKAANEMKERIQKKLNVDKLPFIGTFHNFALNHLKQGEKKLSIIDENTKIFLIKSALENSGIKSRPKNLLNRISKLKQEIDFKDDSDDEFLSVFNKYEKLKKDNFLIDFDDILINFIEDLKDEDFKKEITKKFSYILIDEFQDLNKVQYEIIRKVSNIETPVFIIGDPDQSIYGFRGADADFFEKFKRDFKEVNVLNLEKNYRSSESIIDASFQIISNGENEFVRKKVFSGIKGEKKIQIIVSPTEYSQAQWISNEIQNLIGGTGHHLTYRNNYDYEDASSYSFSDIAVLCRTKKETDILSEILERNSIPHKKINENNISDDINIRKLLSYIKMLNKEPDISDLILNPFGLKFEKNNLKKDVFENKIFVDKLDKLDKFRKLMTDLNVEKLIDKVVESTELSEKKDDEDFNIKKEYLKSFSCGFKSIEEFLTNISLNRISDVNIPGEKVNLMTIHASKGLEFPVVFVPGCINGNIPFIADNKETDIEEERRIFYVALTRAKEKLYLLRPRKRDIFGKKVDAKGSPFLKDVEKNLLKEIVLKSDKKTEKENNQLSLF